MTIYDRIKAVRKAIGLSQEELAHKCGYADRSMIARIESGQVDLPLSKVEVFARALNVSAAFLAGYEEKQAQRDRIIKYAENITDMIEKFNRLDEVDANRINERIDTMLEDQKYVDREKAK